MKYFILLFYISYTKKKIIYGPPRDKFLAPPLELSLVMWSCLVCMEVRSWLQRFVPKTVQVFCGSCWSHAPTRLGLSYSSVFYYPLVSMAAAKSSERTPTFLAASWDWRPCLVCNKNSLPIKQNLKSQHIPMDETCTLCDDHQETFYELSSGKATWWSRGA